MGRYALSRRLLAVAISGDGKADLVARDSSGNLYRNSGDGKGSFGARVKIASGWSGYKSLS